MSMTEINFLPTSYFEAKKRKSLQWRHRLAVAGVGAVLLAMTLTGGHDVAQLRHEVDVLDQSLIEARQTLEEVDRLRAQRVSLIRQITLERELALPVSQTQVMATVASLMPESVGLRRVTVEAQTPKPEKPKKDGAKSKSNSRNDDSKADNKPQPLRVQVSGIAPNDAAVADFVDAMMRHPLFGNVALEYSRITTDGPLMVHEFHLEIEVPLDRIYRPAEESPSASGGEAVRDRHGNAVVKEADRAS